MSTENLAELSCILETVHTHRVRDKILFTCLRLTVYLQSVLSAAIDQAESSATLRRLLQPNPTRWGLNPAQLQDARVLGMTTEEERALLEEMNTLVAQETTRPVSAVRVRCLAHTMNLVVARWIAVHGTTPGPHAELNSEEDSEVDSEVDIPESAERWLERMRQLYPVSHLSVCNSSEDT